MDEKIKLILSLVSGPFVALMIAGIIGAFISITEVDPLIVTGVALKTQDVRLLSEIVPSCILVPIPLWSFLGLLFFMLSEM